jgi:hypothetical protein
LTISPARLRQILGVLQKPLRHLRRKILEVLELHSLLIQPALGAAGMTNRQIAAHDHAVKTGQHAGNLVLMLANKSVVGYKSMHGVFSQGRCGKTTLSLKKTPFSLLFRLRPPQ